MSAAFGSENNAGARGVAGSLLKSGMQHFVCTVNNSSNLGGTCITLYCNYSKVSMKRDPFLAPLFELVISSKEGRLLVSGKYTVAFSYFADTWLSVA